MFYKGIIIYLIECDVIFKFIYLFYFVCVCFAACDEWTFLPNPSLHRDVNRFGHTAVVSNG